ncbi:hypothetical protein GGS20DRAFT_597461 [Poronia punctata]|nr:hypothetical protein GGS20DRAFT_597461 [Poronia punctata]
MDSGSYNHIRRGATPSSSLSPATPTYKTNVNRTKTRKWVEAKMQSYDGDDWGNDYDDYDEGDEPNDEPEPPPPKSTGLRQPGQQTGYQLPSSRTFPQSTAFSPPNTDVRPRGPSVSRNSDGPPLLHVQTQPAASRLAPLSYAAKSGHAEPRVVSTTPPSSSTANNTPGSQIAGSASIPSRFPPRKSSMGQQDRPEITENPIMISDSQLGSNFGNKPFANQPSGSPAQTTMKANRQPPFIRPSDIYRRIDEEKGSERISTDSGRPSMDGIPGRAEGTSSPAQPRLSGEQRRRTSFESHEGADSSHGRRSNLAPVAERKSEYGMEGMLAKASPGIVSLSPEQTRMESEPLFSQDGLSDGAKADLAKDRRFSTSPQLPNLTRVSGFGVDFFSGSSHFSPGMGSDSPNPSTESQQLSTRAQMSPNMTGAANQDGGQEHGATGNSKEGAEKRAAEGKSEGSTYGDRPQLPGAWVSESTFVQSVSEQGTPVAVEATQVPTTAAQATVNKIAQEGSKKSDTPAPTSDRVVQLSSTGISGNTGSDNAMVHAGENSDGALTSGTPGTLVDGGSSATPPPLLHAETKGFDPGQSLEPTPQTPLPLASPSPTGTDNLQLNTPAPLNPFKVDGQGQEIGLPLLRKRQATASTIETTSPEKDLESDKLREEIIKSLSPGEARKEPAPGNLTRESTYLAGDKSLQEISLEAKGATHTRPSQSEQSNNNVEGPSGFTEKPEPGNGSRPRRFSWQQSADEEILSPAEAQPTMSTFSQESPLYSQRVSSIQADAKATLASPTSGSLHADGGGTGAISHQVSQVSSRAVEDVSISAIEPPSPVSVAQGKSPKLVPDGQNASNLSLADEKEKAIMGDTQSVSSGALEQHPALAEGQDLNEHGVTHASVAPPTFREILNLASCEQRILKFDETREQFYSMDSGLSNWLAYLHAAPEHTNGVMISNVEPIASKPSAQAPSFGGSGASPLSYNGGRIGALASQSRRASISNVQQLMTGQSSNNLNPAGHQVGAKSKELLHAAGVFGNKGVKSGMKLFNKGKSKLRERTVGEKPFF